MKRRPVLAAFATLAVILVLGSVILGLFVIGSPLEARRRRADQRRVQDLIAIADKIRDHISSGKEVASLADIPLSPGAELTDPETGKPYEFRRIDRLTFQLCATFDTTPATIDRENDYTYSQYEALDSPIRHYRAGPNCFTLKVK